jgi:hypothetical protein
MCISHYRYSVLVVAGVLAASAGSIHVRAPVASSLLSIGVNVRNVFMLVI